MPLPMQQPSAPAVSSLSRALSILPGWFETGLISLGSLFVAGATLLAGPLDGDASLSIPSTRYGPFNSLDHRSGYGTGVFPEPFLNDDSDLEVNEFRFDWMHTEALRLQNDLFTMEIEKGFGQLTVEVEFHFERDWEGASGVTQGIGNIDLGARYPLFQYVSANGLVDATFGVGVELGIPVHSSVSRNTEFVPKVFNDLKLGSHFTLQTIVGYSTLFGPGDDSDTQVLEYGFTAGWTFQHKELPLPGIRQFTPIFELSGEKQLNKDDAGVNNIVAK